MREHLKSNTCVCVYSVRLWICNFNGFMCVFVCLTHLLTVNGGFFLNCSTLFHYYHINFQRCANSKKKMGIIYVESIFIWSKMQVGFNYYYFLWIWYVHKVCIYLFYKCFSFVRQIEQIHCVYITWKFAGCHKFECILFWCKYHQIIY